MLRDIEIKDTAPLAWKFAAVKNRLGIRSEENPPENNLRQSRWEEINEIQGKFPTFSQVSPLLHTAAKN